MTHLDPNHQDGIDQIDKQGEGCLGMVVGAGVGIVLCMIIMALQGCASAPALPAATTVGAQPNCIAFCTAVTTSSTAESEDKQQITQSVTNSKSAEVKP